MVIFLNEKRVSNVTKRSSTKLKSFILSANMNMFQVDSKAVDFFTSFNFDQPEFMLPEQDYVVYPTEVSSSGVPGTVPPFEPNVSSVSLVLETP